MNPYLVMTDPCKAPVYHEVLEVLASIPGHSAMCARVMIGLELDLSSSVDAVEMAVGEDDSKTRFDWRVALSGSASPRMW